MTQIDIVQYLDYAEYTLGPDSPTYQALSRAYRDIEDLQVYRLWGSTTVYSSSTVNSTAKRYRIFAGDTTAGQEDVLYLMPYEEREGLEIYSDRLAIVIATRNPDGFGFVPVEGWQQALEKAGFRHAIIKNAKLEILKHTPISYM